MSRIFPFDCKDCQHMQSWDMSVDDITCKCKVLNLQVDLCDAWLYGYRCPLDDDKEVNENV